jgi:hypothetical protein
MDKAAKEAFFNELYELDKDSEEEDSCDASVILRRSRPATSESRTRSRTPRHSILDSVRSGPSLARTVSAPLPPSTRVGRLDIPSKSQSQDSNRAPDMFKPSDNAATLRATLKQTGKRKRGESLKLMPESEQIFNGLSFCKTLLSRVLFSILTY